MIPEADGLPGAEGMGSLMTVIVKVCSRDADELSVTLYSTVDVPTLVGVPLTVRLDAVNDSPAGRLSSTLCLYGAFPPFARGSVNDVETSFVSVRLGGTGRDRGVGRAVVVPYRLEDQSEYLFVPLLVRTARTSNS